MVSGVEDQRNSHPGVRAAGADHPQHRQRPQDRHPVAGHGALYDLLRMFGRDGAPLGQAFIEYGRIAKRLHLLALVDPVDGTYQRRMHWQLTVQESRHRLARRSVTAPVTRFGRAYREGQEDQLAALASLIFPRQQTTDLVAAPYVRSPITPPRSRRFWRGTRAA